MPIKHLVLAGGGMWGLSCYGALRESEKTGFWHLADLESIHATSVGAILASILALKYEWDWIDDYLIKRPWHQVFKLDLSSLFSVYQSRGLLTRQCMVDIFKPLLLGKDLSVDITLAQFFEVTGIELHFFSTEINCCSTSEAVGTKDPSQSGQTSLVDFSHLTHPDWRLIDAVYCSACLPILFTPFLHEGNCYVDGGIITRYPVDPCCQRNTDLTEIFGINKTYEDNVLQPITETSTIFDYLFSLILRIVDNNRETGQITASSLHRGPMTASSLHRGPMTASSLPNQLDIVAGITSITEVFNVTSTQEERIRLIEVGAKAWEDWETGTGFAKESA